MCGTFPKTEPIAALPLWAQVLLAQRLVRRLAILVKNPTVAIALLDQLEQATREGSWSDSQHHAVKKRSERLKDAAFGQAVYFVSDTALAANDSGDFEAAESACTASALKAIQAAASSNLWNPIQAQTYVAVDLDLLQFACQESRVGRYNPIPNDVFARLLPIIPP